MSVTQPSPPAPNYQLARFSVIACVDSKNGISKDGKIPWSCPEDLKNFQSVTTGTGQYKNIVIMGHKTYLSLPDKSRPLPDRVNLVLSRNANLTLPGVRTFVNLMLALQWSAEYQDINHHSNVFIIGGEEVYRRALNRYLYLCDRIYLTQLEKDYQCDRFFPIELIENLPSPKWAIGLRIEGGKHSIWDVPRSKHPEYQYLDLLQNILDTTKDIKEDRTGVGTYSIFGATLEFDVSTVLPVITTKKVSISHIIKELLWMISGSTDSKVLEKQGVNIWKGNSTREFLDKRGLKNYREGDIGPGYGFQWRHCGANYKGCDAEYDDKDGYDQLQHLIDNLKSDPFSRRHIVSAWNVEDLSKMALPPCHLLMQMNVSEISGQKHLDLQVYLRSSDTFLGLPYNLTFYALLLKMIAHLVKMKPRKLRLVTGDTHIYSNHVEQVQEQLRRMPLPFPTVKFEGNIQKLGDFNLNNIIVEDYLSWPVLKAPMAV